MFSFTGYNDVLLIPAGATNIVVREVKASNNYLGKCRFCRLTPLDLELPTHLFSPSSRPAAVRNVTGHYYLNGNWRIDFPREVKFAGATFHYERRPHSFIAPESISCLGPITEALYVVVSHSSQQT